MRRFRVDPHAVLLRACPLVAGLRFLDALLALRELSGGDPPGERGAALVGGHLTGRGSGVGFGVLVRRGGVGVGVGVGASIRIRDDRLGGGRGGGGVARGRLGRLIARRGDRPEARRGGDDCGAAVAGPGHAMPGQGRVVDALDPSGVVLLARVAVGAGSLPVDEAGDPSGGERHDVIALANRGFTIGGTAETISP